MHDLAKKEWLKALRSGEYKQGEGYLAVRKDDSVSYCCLGVLCEVARKFDANVFVGEKQIEDDFVITYDRFSGHLPESIVKWAGLNSADPFVNDGTNDTPLSVLNDDGCSFEEIADLIENEL